MEQNKLLKPNQAHGNHHGIKDESKSKTDKEQSLREVIFKADRPKLKRNKTIKEITSVLQMVFAVILN